MQSADKREQVMPRDRGNSVKSAAEIIGICQRSMRGLIADGKVKTTKIGRRTIVRDSEIERLLREGA